MGVSDGVRQILLPHPVVAVIMGILVPLFPLQPGGVRVNILKFPRDIAAVSRLHVRPSGHDPGRNAVGLRRCGDQHGSLRQGQLRLRQSQLHGRVHAGFHDGDGLRIGKTHILTGRAQQAAAGSDQIPRFQKAGQIVERRIRVAAPEGFVKRGCSVIHGVAAPVIPHGAALRQSFGVSFRQKQSAVLWHSRFTEKLRRVDGFPHIAAAALRHQIRHAGFPCQGQGRPPLHDLQRPQDRRADLLRRDGIELKHAAAGKQGVVHIEKGILRGGGDEGQGAVLHELQQALLLLFVEVLDLIQIQQNSAGGQQRPRVDQTAQNAAGSQQMTLAYHLIQCFRTDLVR